VPENGDGSENDANGIGVRVASCQTGPDCRNLSGLRSDCPGCSGRSAAMGAGLGGRWPRRCDRHAVVWVPHLLRPPCLCRFDPVMRVGKLWRIEVLRRIGRRFSYPFLPQDLDVPHPGDTCGFGGLMEADGADCVGAARQQDRPGLFVLLADRSAGSRGLLRGAAAIRFKQVCELGSAQALAITHAAPAGQVGA
jgi:hypothetical protein